MRNDFLSEYRRNERLHFTQPNCNNSAMVSFWLTLNASKFRQGEQNRSVPGKMPKEMAIETDSPLLLILMQGRAIEERESLVRAVRKACFTAAENI